MLPTEIVSGTPTAVTVALKLLPVPTESGADITSPIRYPKPPHVGIYCGTASFTDPGCACIVQLNPAPPDVNWFCVTGSIYVRSLFWTVSTSPLLYPLPWAITMISVTIPPADTFIFAVALLPLPPCKGTLLYS